MKNMFLFCSALSPIAERTFLVSFNPSSFLHRHVFPSPPKDRALDSDFKFESHTTK